jgi:hypothetical protein
MTRDPASPALKPGARFNRRSVEVFAAGSRIYALCERFVRDDDQG